MRERVKANGDAAKVTRVVDVQTAALPHVLDGVADSTQYQLTEEQKDSDGKSAIVKGLDEVAGVEKGRQDSDALGDSEIQAAEEHIAQ